MVQGGNTYQKLVVQKLTTNFSEATEVVTCDLDQLQPGRDQVLVKVHYVGINASDINFTSGRYDPSVKPPFDSGFEGVGVIDKVGDDVQHLKTGQPVLFMQAGSFAEYVLLNQSAAVPIPEASAKFLVAAVSGLTAALALTEKAQLKQGETVLITASAGGLGHFAVQYAKKVLKAKTVIGTCSTEEKAEKLKHWGCDLVINYKTENVGDVLKTKFPKGIDCVFESVGGQLFKTCLNSLAPRGRILVIGSIVSYKEEGGKSFQDIWQDQISTAILLSKSLSIHGFFLNNYYKEIPQVLPQLIKSIASNEIEAYCDMQDFTGLKDITRAVDHLHSGKSCGKVIVPLLKADDQKQRSSL
ncbi:hypothetical protein MP228_004220 [Amoeboaphelidium protococcarum]|nr:hypothetical protein MP228_004220 [Amoeboaphelidium protococcarum]